MESHRIEVSPRRWWDFFSPTSRSKRMTSNNEKPVVLVTGSSGLIGSRIVPALTERYRVVGFDVKPLDDEH
jgi:hypothetical protein